MPEGSRTSRLLDWAAEHVELLSLVVPVTAALLTIINLRCNRVKVFGNVSARVTCVLERRPQNAVLTIGSERQGDHWRVTALRFAGEEAFLGSVSL